MQLQDALLQSLVEKVKKKYAEIFNPLGIDDALSSRVKAYRPRNLQQLYPFYQNLAAIYRYKFGDNQLTILWDGADHPERYKEEWRAAFVQWQDQFCETELFIRAILDMTVFLPDNRNAQLAENRMNHFILQHFGVKFHKARGIVDAKASDERRQTA